jgi:MoaA/NifB/PqqE/SkfB family radical SAM enzyme
MKKIIIDIDQDGKLELPQHVKDQIRLVPGSKVLLELDEDRIHLSRSTNDLSRIYIEVTNQCNLNCRTCVRNSWGDQPGSMILDQFQTIIAHINRIEPTPEIFFGGYGEPLSHPDIVTMIQLARKSKAKTSLITNGTLLSQEMSEALLEAGLDMLWVSIDGAKPESYQDIRLGDHLPQIIENLEVFHSMRTKIFGNSSWAGKPELGIAFVLMKKNAAELPQIIELGERFGASQFIGTNLLVHTQEMASEVFYEKCLNHSGGSWEGAQPRIRLPRMDFEGTLGKDIIDLLMQGYPIKIAGNIVNRNPYVCPFVARGAAVIRWDGEVSPCLPLLYEHTGFYGDWERRSYPYSFGNVLSQPLNEIWLDEKYQDLRERLLEMSFSPCVDCHTCEMSEDNLLDCMGYQHPNCGGCLWAHGVIQCP